MHERGVQRHTKDLCIVSLGQKFAVLLPPEHTGGFVVRIIRAVHRDALQHTNKCKKHWCLKDYWQAGGQWIGTTVLVQLHHFLRLLLAIARVLLLDLFDLRLDQLKVALCPDLTHEQRNQDDTNDDDEPDN